VIFKKAPRLRRAWQCAEYVQVHAPHKHRIGANWCRRDPVLAQLRQHGIVHLIGNGRHTCPLEDINCRGQASHGETCRQNQTRQLLGLHLCLDSHQFNEVAGSSRRNLALAVSAIPVPSLAFACSTVARAAFALTGFPVAKLAAGQRGHDYDSLDVVLLSVVRRFSEGIRLP
jgi:hypothetical protein